MDTTLQNQASQSNTGQLLNTYAYNVASQFGEDGIIEKILETIGKTDNWCVEFGAWDGKYLSNTYNLLQNKSYSGVLIEADKTKFKVLQETYKSNNKIHCVRAMVGYDTHNNLDVILAKTPIPKNFDLLSIDIDGNDFHVWEAMRTYQPKTVVIEYNPTVPNCIDFVQAKAMHLTQGCSVKALVRLAKSKNYELVAVTDCNCIFVDKQYFPLFNLPRNAPEDLRDDTATTTYQFIGYDGTVFLGGNTRMIWHQINMKENLSQQLPKFLRKFPERYNWFQKILASLYFRFCR